MFMCMRDPARHEHAHPPTIIDEDPPNSPQSRSSRASHQPPDLRLPTTGSLRGSKHLNLVITLIDELTQLRQHPIGGPP